ncbi:MAG: rRNA maturation RNase YbeY [Candidimonas sp.]|nr:MAG: rRNA maturation RNase YbeY [Burkholderiales bacterium 21-58-4]TAL87669.1 MAG: rRNA maturation RNase YbeY [Candidimonas sp.]TAM22782.1 MAG: rRNA maturation RNase YbeY [Candidimonas sp.]TAM73698.1 MAG: rRNA maturation RNase YbeY [Candidimonas sp.]
MPPKLTLAVQYGAPAVELPRWRLRRWVQQAVNGVALQLDPAIRVIALTLRLVDAREGRRLNQAFRHRDYATNVLTFEYGTDPEGVASGDIVLCLAVLRREARAQKKTLAQHAAHLTVHGVLHALGHDHIDPLQAQQMESLETRILARMGLPDPYLSQSS